MFASLIRWITAELFASQISLAGAAMAQSNGLTGPALEEGSIVMMFPVDGAGVRIEVGVGDGGTVGIGVENDATGGVGVSDGGTVGIGVENDATGGIGVGDGGTVGIGVENDATGGIGVGDGGSVGIGVGEETNPIKPIESIYNVPWLCVRL